MSQVRVRFIGGPLNGQAVWIDSDRAALSVQVAGRGDALKRTLNYRRDGDLLRFEEPDQAGNGTSPLPDLRPRISKE